MATPVRVFRADTSVDVWCAAIVAATLEERPTILALSIDKAYAEDRRSWEILDRAAALHPWDAVVHLPDLPINRHWLDMDARPRRLRRLIDTRSSVRLLRRRMDDAAASIVGGPVEWETFVTALAHPDIRAFVHALKPVANHYTPHSFVSLNVNEITVDAPHAHPSASPRPVGRRERLKRAVLGRDAVVPTSIPVDTAYSFTTEAPWAASTVLLGPYLGDVGALFDRLPDEMRQRVDALAASPTPTGLLVLSSEERDESYPEWLELLGLVELASHVVEREGLASLLVKPHPRNGEQWLAQVVAALRDALPDVQVRSIAELGGLPVEAIATRISFSAVTGLGSSALVTLSRHLGVPAYCPERLVIQLIGATPDTVRMLDEWFDENRQYWNVVTLSTDHLERSRHAPSVR